MPASPQSPLDRRRRPRRAAAGVWHPLYGALRAALTLVSSFYAAVGIFLVAGAVVAVAGTWVFAEVAGEVREGATQRFDDAVLHWMGAHQLPWLTNAMAELTVLGTGLVVMTMVAVSALFLWLTRHRHSAVLLLVATAGGIVLNGVLKLGFGRPRPQIFEWGTHVVSSSFPSGHAMSAAVVYPTVAYLAARLQRSAWSRALTLGVAALFVLLICVSRLYLGVHYPSDVVAGVVVGLAWAAFCMATLEATQLLAARRAPGALKNEAPSAADAERARAEWERVPAAEE